MDSEKLSGWLQVAGSLVLVASLVFVDLQMQQACGSASEFRLDQENGQSTYEPTWSDIESALKYIDRESNSFFVLEGANGYVQTAGTADRLTVEYRNVDLEGHTHYRIGKKNHSTKTSLRFDTAAASFVSERARC